MDCDTDNRSSRGRGRRNNRIRYQRRTSPSQNDDRTNFRSNDRHSDTSNPAVQFNGECDEHFSNCSGVFLSAESVITNDEVLDREFTTLDRELAVLRYTYQSRTNNHYSIWRNAYSSHLWTLYNLMKMTLKSLKVFVDNKIEFDDFVNFAYTHSSGYISPYT